MVGCAIERVLDDFWHERNTLRPICTLSLLTFCKQDNKLFVHNSFFFFGKFKYIHTYKSKYIDRFLVTSAIKSQCRVFSNMYLRNISDYRFKVSFKICSCLNVFFLLLVLQGQVIPYNT